MFETNTLYRFVRRAVLGLRLPSFETTNQIAIYSLPSAYKTIRNSHPGHPGDISAFPFMLFPFPFMGGSSSHFPLVSAFFMARTPK